MGGGGGGGGGAGRGGGRGDRLAGGRVSEFFLTKNKHLFSCGGGGEGRGLEEVIVFLL